MTFTTFGGIDRRPRSAHCKYRGLTIQGGLMIGTKKSARLVLAALFATLSAIVMWTPASAGTVQAPVFLTGKPTAEVGIAGVGWHNEVAVNRTLYQCPATICNQGQAYPGNNLAEVCTLGSGGTTWGLVFNRANLHTGFIPISQLIYADPPQSCNSVGVGGGVTAKATLYQCPDLNCNQGQAYPGNDIGFICYLGSGSTYWLWALNHANNHEGFIPASNSLGLPTC
jgi:hypothetical protein